jgi:pimeloyl-ACP methyl ester carboxylesterase
MDTNGNPGAREQARSIDEGLFVPIHGVEQWVTIRGGDRENPVLLVISGPGAALSRMAPFFAPWERDFTLVQWDQPGAGATQARNGDAGTGPLTLDRIIRDGLAVTEFVRRHVPADRVSVLALSAGSIIGLQMIKRRPDLFAAYAGSGQVVDWARQDALSYVMLLAEARAAPDQKARQAVAELEQIGPPPYQDAATDAVKSKYAGALTPAEQAVFAALDPAVMAAVKAPPAGARHVAAGLPLLDPRALAMAAYEKLRSELLAFDARRLGMGFEIPMFFFQGDRDAFTVTSEVQAYAAEIRAPRKRVVLIPGGGHSAFFLRDELLALLNQHLRPLAAAR